MEGGKDGESDREREGAPERERGRQTDAQAESKSTYLRATAAALFLWAEAIFNTAGFFRTGAPVWPSGL